MDDDIFLPLIQAAGLNSEMRTSDEHNTAALIASSMNSEYMDEWSAAASYCDASPLNNILPDQNSLREAIDLNPYLEFHPFEELCSTEGPGKNGEADTHDSDDYSLTTMDPAAPVYRELDEKLEIDVVTFNSTVDEFERELTLNLQSIPMESRAWGSKDVKSPTKRTPKKKSDKIPTAVVAAEQTMQKSQSRRSLDSVLGNTPKQPKAPGEMAEQVTARPPTKVTEKVATASPISEKRGVSASSLGNARVDPGKKWLRPILDRIPGKRIKLSQEDQENDETNHSTKKSVLPRAPSYLKAFPIHCKEYPVVYSCNDCAGIFTSLRGGQLHDCIRKRRGRRPKCSN